MNKKNIQRVLLSLLSVISLVSFIYLNTVTIEPKTTDNTEVIPHLYEEEEEQAEVSLPDLEVVKKIIEKGKRIMTMI